MLTLKRIEDPRYLTTIKQLWWKRMDQPYQELIAPQAQWNCKEMARIERTEDSWWDRWGSYFDMKKNWWAWITRCSCCRNRWVWNVKGGNVIRCRETTAVCGDRLRRSSCRYLRWRVFWTILCKELSDIKIGY